MFEKDHDTVFEPRLSLIEESGELISALAKFEADRGDYDKNRKHVIEEMAHVLISMNLVANSYDISEVDILKEVVIKAVKHGYDIEDYGYSYVSKTPNK